jgi:hypothetical protein
MYANPLEKAYLTRMKGRFDKNPAAVKQIQQLTPDQLKEVWEFLSVKWRHDVCVSLKLKYSDNMPDPEAVRGFLMQALEGRHG